MERILWKKRIEGRCDVLKDKLIIDYFVLQVLIRALEKFHISERSYSLGEYAEETICLVKNDLSWCVYGGEKGLKHDIKIYEDCKNACLDLISRIAESNDDEEKLTDFFIAECEKI